MRKVDIQELVDKNNQQASRIMELEQEVRSLKYYGWLRLIMRRLWFRFGK